MTTESSLPITAPVVSKNRRRLVIAGGLSAMGVAGAAGYVITQSEHPLAMAEFFDLSSAMRSLERLHVTPLRTRSGWDLAHVLHHAAQSIEYSLDGFPQLKPAWFRASVGRAAFAVFSARGKMNHGLDEVIPGAPPIGQGEALAGAVDRAMAALQRFDQYTGALAPHFAYGQLSKSEYTRAHLMHFANHWDLVERV